MNYSLTSIINQARYTQRPQSMFRQITSTYVHTTLWKSYLVYYDVNNLYGWAMCQPLPPNFDGLKTLRTLTQARSVWIHPAVIFSILTICSICMIDTLSFCPYRTFQRAISRGKRKTKLLATLYNKQHYVILYRNLQ